MSGRKYAEKMSFMCGRVCLFVCDSYCLCSNKLFECGCVFASAFYSYYNKARRRREKGSRECERIELGKIAMGKIAMAGGAQ